MNTTEEVRRLAFTYWSASYSNEQDFSYGCFRLCCKREEEVRTASDLRPEERRELYEIAIPAIEELADQLYRPCFVWVQWLGNSLCLIPLAEARDPRTSINHLYTLWLTPGAHAA